MKEPQGVLFLVLVTVGLLAVSFACAGCAARQTAMSGDYHLNGVFLLPPGSPAKPDKSQEMRVPLDETIREPGVQAANCSVRDRWFSFEAHGSGKSGGWSARLPLPAAWQDSDLIVNNQSEWDRFFNQLSELPNRGCMTPEAYWATANAIAESMPAPVIYSLFYRYSFGSEGYVKLRPGMRLFIERSIFRDPSGSTEKVSNYWGERKVYYEIEGKWGKGIALRQQGDWRSKGLPRSAGAEFPDTGLARQFSGMRALRLFVLTLFVPPNVHRNSLLIGVRTPEEMVRATAKIKKNPEVPCKELRAKGMACASFEGVVSASVEVNVWVNGEWRYFPIGSTVETALAGVPEQQRAAARQSLRIQRLFRGTYRDVKFSPANPQVPELRLFAGDRISWK